MLPIYFPFTGVGQHLMNIFCVFFKNVAVYQVSEATIPARMKTWRDEQRIDIRLPFQHNEKEIANILREYQTWAQYHRGGDISFFRAYRDTIPFFSDSSVAQIHKEIRAKVAEDSVAGKEEPTDLHAGVFLHMAQDLDEKNREISGGMQSQEMREQEMMQALKGDERMETLDIPAPGGASDDPGYMIPERMAAWAHIMLADNLPASVLITSHRRVLDDLVERMPGGSQAVIFLQSIPAPTGAADQVVRFQDALAEHLEALSALPWDGEKGLPRFDCSYASENPATNLSLYCIPGVIPREIFSCYVKLPAEDNRWDTGDKNKKNNILLGILEPFAG